MICKELNKEFATKEELFKALKLNKEELIAQKKMITKEADSVCFYATTEKGEVVKADMVDIDSIKELKMELVINTTNVMDSHGDVHLKGIWNKCLKEKKDFYLLQEHRMLFDHIITDKVKASARTMKWSELNSTFKGDTQALVFSVEVDKDRNPFMFNQYAKGYVKNHSVGMRYVKLELAINSESKYDIEEKEVWDKYIDEVANKKAAEEQGYFWAVTEAKIIEGSAVPIGSNTITPTLNIQSKDTTTEEPSKDTPKEEPFNVLEAIKNYNI